MRIILALAIAAAAALATTAAVAQTPFRQCVAKAIPELDDRISPADVVAAGVAEACRGALANPTSEHADKVIAGLALRITPLVLDARATDQAIKKEIRDGLQRACGNDRRSFCAELGN